MNCLFELQILYAEREFMAAQMKSANANGAALSKEVAHLKSQLGISQGSSPRGQLQEALLSQSSSSGSISNDIFADANRYRLHVVCMGLCGLSVCVCVCVRVYSICMSHFEALYSLSVLQRRKGFTARLC